MDKLFLRGLTFSLSLREVWLHPTQLVMVIRGRTRFSTVPNSALSQKIRNDDNQPSADSMDRFLDGIHHNHKIKADIGMKKQLWKMKEDRSMQRTRSPLTAVQMTPNSVTVTTSGSAELSRNTSRMHNVDDPKAMLSLVRRCDDNGTSLPSKNILACASVFSRYGESEGVQICQKLMAEHDEYVFSSEMHLDHYLAGALWAEGKLKEAMDVFKRLFYDYPLRRKKIGDLFRFAVLRSMTRYPCPEEMAHLNEFVDFCAGLREPRPAVYLWKALFHHPVPAAHQAAHELLCNYPGATDLVLYQLDSLIKLARDDEDTALLWRLVELLKHLRLLAKDFAHFSGCFFDNLMEIYCKNEDAAGAKQVLLVAGDHATKNGYPLWPETAKRLDMILKSKKQKLPISSFVSSKKPEPVKLQF